MISVLNFKEYRKGSMLGFLDLQISILTVRGAKLMAGRDDSDMWVALPRLPSTDGEGDRKWHEIIHVTAPVREHIRQAVILDLQQQGHLDSEQPAQQPAKQPAGTKPPSNNQDLSEHMPQQDDIPF